MLRSVLITTVAACSSLSCATPLLAAQAPEATATSSPSNSVHMSAAKPAAKCMGDVRAFKNKMSKDGYWLGDSDYGYGYPMDGYEGGLAMGVQTTGNMAGYGSARPGYEVRTLIAAANILAQNGKEQPCQNVLATTRTIYQSYTTDLRGRGARAADGAGWQKRQIEAAQPVTGRNVSFRSDQLIDTDVLSPGNESLGSVHDLVMSPQSGKIAYLVIARGGLFGIDASYTPVPWSDFKMTPNTGLLVLDTTKAVMSAAPQVSDGQFTKTGQFDQESKKVDSYWTSHIKLAATN